MLNCLVSIFTSKERGLIEVGLSKPLPQTPNEISQAEELNLSCRLLLVSVLIGIVL